MSRNYYYPQDILTFDEMREAVVSYINGDSMSYLLPIYSFPYFVEALKRNSLFEESRYELAETLINSECLPYMSHQRTLEKERKLHELIDALLENYTFFDEKKFANLFVSACKHEAGLNVFRNFFTKLDVYRKDSVNRAIAEEIIRSEEKNSIINFISNNRANIAEDFLSGLSVELLSSLIDFDYANAVIIWRYINDSYFPIRKEVINKILYSNLMFEIDRYGNNCMADIIDVLMERGDGKEVVRILERRKSFCFDERLAQKFEGHQALKDIVFRILSDNYSINDSLIIAAENNNLELAKILVANGADVNYSDAEGKTALYVALQRSNSELKEFLLSNGCDIKILGKIQFREASYSYIYKDLFEVLLYNFDSLDLSEENRATLISKMEQYIDGLYYSEEKISLKLSLQIATNAKLPSYLDFEDSILAARSGDSYAFCPIHRGQVSDRTVAGEISGEASGGAEE